MDQIPRASNLTDREMLLLLADQNRRMEQSIDRLTTRLEERLAQGDRRFSEFDARVNAHDARHTAANNAINGLDGRVLDLGRALKAEQDARKALEAKHEAQADEWQTWKVRAQTIGGLAGFLWAFATFVWPFLPRLIQLVGGAP